MKFGRCQTCKYASSPICPRCLNCDNSNNYVPEFTGVYGLVRSNIPYADFYRSSGARVPSIKKVIFNNPCTIVLWNDGTKTIVKVRDD